MKDLIKWFDNLPKLVKAIFALPGIAVLWAIYRLVKAIDSGDILQILVAVVLLIAGPTFVWVIDLITILLYDKVIWFK